MACVLPDAAVACLCGHMHPQELARLMCVGRDLQQQMLRVLATTPMRVSVDPSFRSWRVMLRSVGSWCGCVTHLSLSARHLDMQLLQPLLLPHLTHLSLRGGDLDRKDGCDARQLVDMLLQHCPRLEVLDLQDCDLTHLGILHRLIAPKQQQQQQHPHQHEQGASEESLPCRRTGVKVLQLTGARLAPGPSTASTGTMQAAASAHAANINHNYGRNPRSPPPAAATAGMACGVACEPTQGLQELHLGCQPEQVDSTWLRLTDAVTSHDIIRLLGDHCQALRVLDVSRRPAVTDALLHHLAAHPPASLHTLDVSLTRVTPDGLLMLLRHCSNLRVLRYACRSGDDGLDTLLTQSLAAALPAVQELDLSLHPNLNDGCLAALAQCKTLRKVKFARSHKVTRAGFQQLQAALPMLQELEVVRCRTAPGVAGGARRHCEQSDK